MKNITYAILSFILFLLISNCTGYKPIFSSEGLKYKISDYSITGDMVLGNIIYSKMYKLSSYNENIDNAKNINIKINVLKEKNATVKNSAGKILEYKMLLKAKIYITDSSTNNIVLDQYFVSTSNYKVQTQHFDTIQLENKTAENLVDKIFEKFLIEFSQNL